MLSDGQPFRNKIGTVTTPWNYEVDLKIDKSFRLSRVPITAYIYFQNLLNRKNVINVYWRTGNATDDGFTDAFTPEFIQNATDTFLLYNEINLNHRQHYSIVQGGDLFGRPREIRFGLQVTFGGGRQS